MRTFTEKELAEVIRKHHLWLSGAAAGCADLSFADLGGADLSFAKLSGAAAGNNREIKTLQLGEYYTVITSEKIAVGCQAHTLDKWKAFSDRDILEMDGKDGLAWWKQWRDVIFRVHETIEASRKEAA